MNIYFDIETAPLDFEQLKASIPEFDETKYAELPPFCEADVKLGAIKDKDKVAAKIQAARHKHAQSVIEREAKLLTAKEAHEAKYVERAALHATTGRVLMIAILKDGNYIDMHDDANEAALLTGWWNAVNANHKAGHQFVGFNIFHFDLPFLIRRSWHLDVEVPSWVRNERYWSRAWVDLMDTWAFGNRQEFISLDAIDRFTGGEGKTENGANFYVKWQTERDLAIAYAMNDVAIVERLAKRMGVEDYKRRELVAGEAVPQVGNGVGCFSESVGVEFPV